MKLRLGLLLSALLVTGILILDPAEVNSQTIPKFRDYKTKVYKGSKARLRLKKGEMFRTRIRNAYRDQKINFAGSYIVSTWGCGTSCLMGVAINTRTGRYTMLPGTVCCWGRVDEDFQPVEIRKNSRLMVLSGSVNENEGKGAHFYKLERGKLVLLKTNAYK